MKKRKVFFIKLVLFLLIPISLGVYWAYQYQQSTANVPKTETANEALERKEAYETWLHNAKQVAELSRDEEARQVVRFLEAEATIAIPRFENGLPFITPIYYGRTTEEVNRAKSLPVVPLLPKDSDLAEYWRIQNEQQGGLFIREVNAIVLSGNVDALPIWKGLLLLHEGSHAMRFQQGLFTVNISDPELCDEELHTWNFMLRLLGLAAGSTYRAALQEEVKYIHEQSKLPEVLAPHRSSASKLDPVFGPPLSDNEQLVRDSLFYRHAILTYLEQRFPENSQAMKRQILCPLLVQNSTGG